MPPAPSDGRRRSDAVRNRDRILHAAADLFADEGLSVPVHEVARRAGVGTGTVSRHFPAKQDLYAAVLLDAMQELARSADELAAAADPGDAFFDVLRRLVQEGARHRGLAEALAGGGYDIEAAAVAADADVSARLRALLAAAQQAGAVDPAVTYADVKALMAGCLAADVQDAVRVLDVVCRGLRAQPRAVDLAP